LASPSPELVVGQVELPQGDDRDADESEVTKERLNFPTNLQRKFCATVWLHFKIFLKSLFDIFRPNDQVSCRLSFA